jgi:hypothetical protein
VEVPDTAKKVGRRANMLENADEDDNSDDNHHCYCNHATTNHTPPQ